MGLFYFSALDLVNAVGGGGISIQLERKLTR
jgi:hypothetical protein